MVKFIIICSLSINSTLNCVLILNLIDSNQLLSLLFQDSGADINRSDSFRLDGCSRKPIHYAAACNSLDMVRYLIGRDVDADERDCGNSTPLHHAAAGGNLGTT